MTREEIKDMLEMNYEFNTSWLVDYIFNLESERNKYKDAFELAQTIINNSISRDRYNDLLKRYNKLAKKTTKSKFVDIK